MTFASKVPDNSLEKPPKAFKSLWGFNGICTNWRNTSRNVLLETGTGERAASVVYDRAYSSFAQIEEMEWDLHELFSGVEIFHISGITAALSKIGKV